MKVIRRIPTAERRLFLTFDDGPDPMGTPRVLEDLARHGARATFFVIAEKARRHPEIIRDVVAAGHSIGNHSLDHRFGVFFRPRAEMREWIRRADQMLSDQLGHAPVAFRSPAGVRTPPLHWALADLEIPLVHWSVRFFDTRFAWREKAALRSLHRTAPGAIILLHDTHPTPTLSRYLAEGTRLDFRFVTLLPEDLSGIINP